MNTVVNPGKKCGTVDDKIIDPEKTRY